MGRQFIRNQHIEFSIGEKDFEYYLEQLMYMALLDAASQKRDALIMHLNGIENSPNDENNLLKPFGYRAKESDIELQVGLLPNGWYTSDMELGLNGEDELRVLGKVLNSFKGDVIAESRNYLMFLNDESVASEVANIGKNIGLLIRYK